MQSTDRLAWLDIARGVSIVLVVVFHASIRLERAGLGDDLFWWINNLFAPVRMPVFFAIAGFLAHRALRLPFADLLERRIWPLAYLFGLWTLINFVFRHVVQGVAVGDPVRALAKAVLVPPSEIWFILALGLYLVLTRLLGGRARGALVGAAFAVSVASFGGLLPSGGSAHQGILGHYAFFLLGCLHGGALIPKVATVPAPAVALLGLLYLVLFEALNEVDGLAHGLVRTALCLAGLALGCRLASAAAAAGGLAAGVARLGRSTLAIYLAHPILLSLAVMALPAGLPAWAGLPLLPVLVAGSIAAALGLNALSARIGLSFLYGPPALRRPLGLGPAR